MRFLKMSKLLFVAGVAGLGVTLGATPASATLILTGTGFNPEGPANASAQAAFTLSGSTLQLVLTNTTSPRTANQGNALTGIIFSIAGSPTLTYNATANPTLPSGSHIWTGLSTQNDATPLSSGAGSSWTNQLAASPPHPAGYGVATTGFAGEFNGGSIAVGNASPDYGIVASGTFPVPPNSFGGSQFPFIQNSLVFDFTVTPSSFAETDINNVGFLFGTDGTGFIPASNVPEPATLLLLGAGLAGMSFIRRHEKARSVSTSGT